MSHISKIRMVRGSEGFTLLEIMVVIVALGLLASLTIPRPGWETRRRPIGKGRQRYRSAGETRWICTSWITGVIPARE